MIRLVSFKLYVSRETEVVLKSSIVVVEREGGKNKTSKVAFKGALKMDNR